MIICIHCDCRMCLILLSITFKHRKEKMKSQDENNRMKMFVFLGKYLDKIQFYLYPTKLEPL